MSGRLASAPRSISGRIALIAAGLVLLILVLGGAALTLLLRDVLESNFDRRLVQVLDGVVAASSIDRNSGALAVDRSAWFQPGFGGTGEALVEIRPTWQIGRPETGPSALLPEGMLVSADWPSGWGLTIPQEVGGEGYEPIHQSGPGGEALHAFARRIRLPGASDWLVYAVAGDLRVVEAEMDRVKLLLTAVLGVLGLLLVAAVFIQLRVGLRPLRAVGARLADIRAGRAERLEGAFPSEVAGLTGELNALLDFNKNLIERGRNQIGDLAHCLKTPLAVLTNETDKHAQVDSELTRQQIESMRDHIDRYLMRARVAAARDLLGARAPVLPVAGEIRAALARLHAERNLEIALEGDPTLAFRGDREDLSEMIGNLLDNACKWAERRVVLAAVGDGAQLDIVIEDDGPGLRPEQRSAALARGERLDASKPGSGLGLAIVQEIAEAYGGTLALDAADLGGLRVRLTLPQAAEGGSAT